MKVNQVVEGLRDPKDNPCWKGYKPVGTKKKNGKTVPNCVPKESISEISANPDYLRAAERSRSQARDTQRTFGKSPEEKAAARRTEIKRDKGIAGYSKRYNKANPRPKVEPRSDLKGASGPQDWYGQNRYMGDSVAEGGMKDYAIQQVVDQLLDGELDPYDVMSRPQGPAQEQMAAILQDMYDDVAMDFRLHPDDDFEQIFDRVMDRLEDEYGHSGDQNMAESKNTIKVPVTQKPRQGPLKPQTGGGKHRDKKKEMKQGKEKHKKPVYEAGTLKVQKDDDKATVLLNPATGVQTQIDKSNPNAPRLTQDEQGKLKLSMAQGAQTGGMNQKPNLVGKDVAIDTSPVEDVHRISASPVQPGGEITDVNPRSPISGEEDHDEISKLLNQRLRKLAGL